MTLKTLATGSTGNSYILSHNGKHLILDAGIPVAEIKKGIDYDIGNIEACLITHSHLDHCRAVKGLENMGIKVWQPYIDKEHKRVKTYFGDFEVECFDVPHGCENRAFLVNIDNTTVLYATDYEYIPYNLVSRNINIALVEMNYQTDRIVDMDEHRKHTVLHHAEEKTVIEFLASIKNSLRTVVLCHMSKSGLLDRDLAMEHIREVIPENIDVQYAVPKSEVNLDECPF